MEIYELLNLLKVAFPEVQTSWKRLDHRYGWQAQVPVVSRANASLRSQLLVNAEVGGPCLARIGETALVLKTSTSTNLLDLRSWVDRYHVIAPSGETDPCWGIEDF